MPFYGLYIPAKNGNGQQSNSSSSNTNAAANITNGAGGKVDTQNSSAAVASSNADLNTFVFRDKSEALDVLKKHKEARLREFICEDDAIKYAHTGYEVVQTRYADVKTSTANVEKAPFRTPTKQELIEFRKIIESGNYERVKLMIWENPRYLVSSGDTPTALKEGYRYNAMHICAISKKPRIAELLLETVSDPKFVDHLTGKKGDEKMCKELAANLLDYYLNIPEKGRSETPLHFAAKYGAIDVIEVLTSYSECKMIVNSDGFLPKDIICLRVPSASPEICKKIESLLEKRFYVPVLRSSDNAIPPKIGEPFPTNNPPNLNSDPLSPEVKIQAIAGPMNMEQAQQFRRRWKTPPRLGGSTSSPVVKPAFISPIKSCVATPRKTPTGSPSHTLKRRTLFNSKMNSPLHDEERALDNGSGDNQNCDDAQNGNVGPIQIRETNNNNHGHEISTPKKNSKQHQLFSLSTPLMKFKGERFSAYRDQQDIASPNIFMNDMNDDLDSSDIDILELPSFRERHIKITDTEKGLETIGRELAKEHNVEWSEYWDFLDKFIDISTEIGLQELENYFEQRKKTEIDHNKSVSILDGVCMSLEKFQIIDGKITTTTNESNGFNGFNLDRTDNGITTTSTLNNLSTAQQPATPYTCVEKSLQVFAKRMTKTIINNIDNVVSINDTLMSELKRLKSLICSFMEDARFVDVNFLKVHSRISNLVSVYLYNSQEVTAAVKSKVKSTIQNLVLTPGERREHIGCVCGRIVQLLDAPMEQILPENLKTEEMCSNEWLKEKECNCQWDTNLSRKTSRRNRMETRIKQQQQELKKDEKENKEQTNSNIDVANDNTNDSDNTDDEVFCSDFDDANSDDEEEVWTTPPESPSRMSLLDGSDDNEVKIYVYGNEPTKRDLDVLNAIVNCDINKEKFPNIHKWKTTLLRFPNEEMEYFPSPAVVKKSQNFVANKRKDNLTPRSLSQNRFLHSPKQTISPMAQQKHIHKQKSNITSHNKQTQQQQPQMSLPVRRLLKSPHIHHIKQQNQHQRPKTPLNKFRGLFSVYREPKTDDSPTSSLGSDRSDGGRNVSLNLSGSD